jgi:hypothetical protein
MATFKGDSSYNSYHDDAFYNSVDSSDEDLPRRIPDPSRARREWIDEHYEVLMELYRAFKGSGEGVFGRAFFQTGDFNLFVHFLYENTCLVDADLLKAEKRKTHVCALGLGARRKHDLHVHAEGKNDGGGGSGREGTRGCWSEAVRASTTARCKLKGH